MVEYRHPFRCEVFTPTGKVFAGELASAKFPAPDGLVGVLAGRGPLVMLLGSGPFVTREMNGRRARYFVAGGFARFKDDLLTLMTDQCMPIEQIDPEAAWQEIEQAQQMPEETSEQIERRGQALLAARNKFNLAQKHRKETEGA